MNAAYVMGRLGRDPELKEVVGKKVCRFSVAVDQVKKEEPTWLRVCAWDKLAETCAKHLKKGSPVLIQGHIRTGRYTGKDGVAKETFEIVAHTVKFLGGTSLTGTTRPEPKEEADDAGVPF